MRAEPGNRVFLGLGSNAGDSEAILSAVALELSTHLEAFALSSLWRSEPRYYLDQPPFLNRVATGLCSLEPEELLDLCASLEAGHGRDRSREIVKGPRTLDIDILLYGGRVLDTVRLTLPHPGMEERKFVLLPLAELDPALVNPRTGRLYIEALGSLPPQGIYLVPPPGYDRLYV